MSTSVNARQLASNIRLPFATYRLQFHSQFTLPQATALAQYLHSLGISDYYASPIFAARPESQHGYDVIDATQINPELGTERDLRILATALQQRSMGLILDIVPNHMCIAGGHNNWWNDLLENGPSSPYATFFDIDWCPPKRNLENKVLLPILGDQFGRVLENQELQLGYQNGNFYLQYYDTQLPIAPCSSILILRLLLESLPPNSVARAELGGIVFDLEHLPPRNERDIDQVNQRRRTKEIVRQRMAALVNAEPELQSALLRIVETLNGTKGDPRSFDRLEELLAAQAYRLSFWRVAAEEINYRRFFDVNDLAAIRIENPEVFAIVHKLIFRLLREGIVTGLRVDHIDGLLDPEGYLEQLQSGCRKALSLRATPAIEMACYVVAEKILGQNEPLRSNWATHGTTGYDFLNLLNGLFVDKHAQSSFEQTWRRIAGHTEDFDEVVYEGKKLVLNTALSGELQVLARNLERIAEQHRYSRDFTLNSLRQALSEVIACFPVYRSYLRKGGEEVSQEDQRSLMLAVWRAQRRNPSLNQTIFAFLRGLLLQEEPPEGLTEAQRTEWQNFVLRFQQLTSPVTAKGVEDTAFYRYYPLASLCEVGGQANRFGITRTAFHEANQHRLQEWPYTMNATSTHDTKRSEDVRARLNVLSELPTQWERAVRRWQRLNQKYKTTVEEQEAPDAREEYLIYQTLVGTFPFHLPNEEGRQRFLQRMQEYIVKALREAKRHSSWLNPNEDYERAVQHFIAQILTADSRFLTSFLPFQALVSRAGIFNSLAQTLLKITVPGVPDFYQGTDLWDFSLVDPDNRHPVDYEQRKQFLAGLPAQSSLDDVQELLRQADDGRIKLFVTQQSLALRRQYQNLFLHGEYLPLFSAGLRARHVVSFARRDAEQTIVVIAARFFTSLLTNDDAGVSEQSWENTTLLPHQALTGRFRDVFTGREISLENDQGLLMAPICAPFPFALLVRI